jgi:hypothetical protein
MFPQKRTGQRTDQLNYTQRQHKSAICKVERHHPRSATEEFDEVYVAVKPSKGGTNTLLTGGGPSLSTACASGQDMPATTLLPFPTGIGEPHGAQKLNFSSE